MMGAYEQVTLTPDQIYRREVAMCAARGWQIQYGDPVGRTAVLWSPGGDSAPWANLLACLLTGFLWAPFWIIIAIRTPGPKQMTLTVSDAGEVHYTKPAAPGKTR